jgi:hypothetical protein
MQSVIKEFTHWFAQFVLVATVILIVGHVIGTKRRARKKLKLKEKQAVS